MSGEPCKQCGDAFDRKKGSKAAYCSADCRRNAAEARELAPLRKYSIDLTGPTDDFDITYRAMVWPPGAISEPTLQPEEKLVTVRGWGDVPPTVRAHIIAHEPEMIPEEVMALAPGDALQALHLHLGYDPRTFRGHGPPAAGLDLPPFPTTLPDKDNHE